MDPCSLKPCKAVSLKKAICHYTGDRPVPKRSLRRKRAPSSQCFRTKHQSGWQAQHFQGRLLEKVSYLRGPKWGAGLGPKQGMFVKFLHLQRSSCSLKQLGRVLVQLEKGGRAGLYPILPIQAALTILNASSTAASPGLARTRRRIERY